LTWPPAETFEPFLLILRGDLERHMFRRGRGIGLFGLIYIIIGLVVAWEKHYITVHLLKTVLSALLAIFLWWLVLLGVNLHIH
jgi:hypothetical protein